MAKILMKVKDITAIEENIFEKAKEKIDREISANIMNQEQLNIIKVQEARVKSDGERMMSSLFEFQELLNWLIS